MTCPASNICCFHSILSNYITFFGITRPIYWKSCPQPCFPLSLHLFSHCCSFRVSFRPWSFPVSPSQQNLQSSFRIQTELVFLSSRSIPINAVLPKHGIIKCLCFWNVNLPTLSYLKPTQIFGISVQIALLISVANTSNQNIDIKNFYIILVTLHSKAPKSSWKSGSLGDIHLFHSLPRSLWIF